MSRVLALAEGQTEQAVLEMVVAPHLSLRDVHIHPRLVGKPGHKGGVRRAFETVVNDINALARQEPTSTITTFFDYYALPHSWPGVAESKGKPSSQIPGIVETAIGKSFSEKVAGLSYPPTRVGRIGLDTIRKACPHFGEWVGRLESLGSPMDQGNPE